MLRFIEYAVFFVAVTVLQVFLFSNLNLGIYIHPLVFTAFILLLPMETRPVTVLLLGLFTGLVIDVSTGMGGLYMISTVFVAFLRPYLLSLIVGRDEVKEGGTPFPIRIGYGKYFRYAGMMVMLQCLVFFSFESMSIRYYYLTLVKVAASTVVTVILIIFVQMLLAGSREKPQKF